MIVIVGTAIIRKTNKFLFVKEFKPSAIGKWGLPGGKLEEGESIVDCVHREVQEETGHTVTAEKLFSIGNKPHTHEGNTVIRFFFMCEVSSEQQSLPEHETSFFSLDEASRLAEQGLIRGEEIIDMLKASLQPQQHAGPFLRVIQK